MHFHLRIARDCDIAGFSIKACADTSSVEATFCCNIATGDGNVTPAVVAATTASNSCGIITTSRHDVTAGDGDVTSVSFLTAADTRTSYAAGGLDITALFWG